MPSKTITLHYTKELECTKRCTKLGMYTSVAIKVILPKFQRLKTCFLQQRFENRFQKEEEEEEYSIANQYKPFDRDIYRISPSRCQNDIENRVPIVLLVNNEEKKVIYIDMVLESRGEIFQLIILNSIHQSTVMIICLWRLTLLKRN